MREANKQYRFIILLSISMNLALQYKYGCGEKEIHELSGMRDFLYYHSLKWSEITMLHNKTKPNSDFSFSASDRI